MGCVVNGHTTKAAPDEYVPPQVHRTRTAGEWAYGRVAHFSSRAAPLAVFALWSYIFSRARIMVTVIDSTVVFPRPAPVAPSIPPWKWPRCGAVEVGRPVKIRYGSPRRRWWCRDTRRIMSDVPAPPPPEVSPKSVATLKRHILGGARPHEAPHLGDSGQRHSKRVDPQLLGLLGFYHINSHMDFFTRTDHVSGGGEGATAASLSSDPPFTLDSDQYILTS